MNPIKALTPTQKALIAIYREKWRRIALSTKPIDRSTATTAAQKVYQLLELPEPKIVFAQSPHEVLSKFIPLEQEKSELYR